MADIRVITHAGLNKAIMRGNTQIGYIDENDEIWMFRGKSLSPKNIGNIDHPSEAVKLVDEWLKQR